MPVPDPAPEAAPAAPSGDFAPTPFTAEQIRDAMPAGTVIRWKMGVAGQEATTEWRVRAADAEGMTLESRAGDRPTDTSRATWEELRDHARFPSALTTVETGVPLTTGLGALTTAKYTVTDAEGTRIFWFDPSLPGPPVQHETVDDGAVTFHMEQIGRERVDPSTWDDPE